jgi:hypothetical protein
VITKLTRTLTAALLLGLAPLVASPVSASTPRPVSMSFEQNGDTYETLGWVATGAIEDAGDWNVTHLVLGSPRTMLFGDVESIQTSAAGSFRLQWHGGTTPTGGVAAAWRLFDGTGIYAGLHGEGAWSQAFTPGRITFMLSGTVHQA